MSDAVVSALQVLSPVGLAGDSVASVMFYAPVVTLVVMVPESVPPERARPVGSDPELMA